MEKTKKFKGYSFSHVSRELGFSFRAIQSLIREGDLKLNDYDKIDEEYYLKFKAEWDKKPDWMKKKR